MSLVDGDYWNEQNREFPELKQLRFKSLIFNVVLAMLNHNIEDFGVKKNKEFARVEKDGELVGHFPTGKLTLSLEVQMPEPSIEEVLKAYEEGKL
jgi:hypothetical protein